MTTAHTDDRPTCTNCHHPLDDNAETGYACHTCQQNTARRLQQIPHHFKLLNTTAALMRGTSPTNQDTPTAPSKIEAPIPVDLGVLTLVGPGGISTRLQAIVDSWQRARGIPIRPRTTRDGRTLAPWRDNPTRTVPANCTWLANNLRWASISYPSIDQDITEIRRLHAQCEKAITREPPESCVIVACAIPGCTGTLRVALSTKSACCPTCATGYDCDTLRSLSPTRRHAA